ncbi:retrovirus-related pol polyprotein from transposon TNT 1-94 [Tanacetum coccineum]
MSEAEPIPPTSSVTALRIPMIKKGEYDLWSMKMRQYIAITDHILWDIITMETSHNDPRILVRDSDQEELSSFEIVPNSKKMSEAEPIPPASSVTTLLDDWSIEIDADHVDLGQDGLGVFDWSEEADNAPIALALMATSSTDSSNSKVPYCSKCSKSYKKLLENYQTERDNFQRARSEILGYQMSLESLEVMLKTHEKNEYAWGDKYEQMEYDLKIRDLKLEEKQKELDQVLKERDDFKVKLEKWTNASVLQNEVLNKQRYLSDKSCIGFGVESSSGMESDNSSGDETLTDHLYENFKREKAYKAVPPPTGTIIPPRANVSFTGIDELAIRNKVVNQEKTKLVNQHLIEIKSPKVKTVLVKNLGQGDLGTNGGSRGTRPVGTTSKINIVISRNSRNFHQRRILYSSAQYLKGMVDKVTQAVLSRSTDGKYYHGLDSRDLESQRILTINRGQSRGKISRDYDLSIVRGLLWSYDRSKGHLPERMMSTAWLKIFFPLSNHLFGCKATEDELSYGTEVWGMSTSKISTVTAQGILPRKIGKDLLENLLNAKYGLVWTVSVESINKKKVRLVVTDVQANSVGVFLGPTRIRKYECLHDLIVGDLFGCLSDYTYYLDIWVSLMASQKKDICWDTLLTAKGLESITGSQERLKIVFMLNFLEIRKTHKGIGPDWMIAFDEEKRRFSIAQRVNVHVDSTFTLRGTKKVLSLRENSWVEAMQDEMLQFKLKRFGCYVTEPEQKGDLGTKWVVRIKQERDERRFTIITRQARLVEQGYRQKSMDVRVHSYMATSQKWCSQTALQVLKILLIQIRFTRVVKALIGLHQAQEHGYERTLYFSFELGYSLSMVKDFEDSYAKEFKMSSMGELTFFLGFIVKQSNGDSPFHLEAFSDSDYAGDNHDRRSTSGGCQYLGRRLVSWQCKKQTIVAISSKKQNIVAVTSWLITPLTPSMLEVVTALAAEEEQSTSPHSRAASSARDAQGTHTQSAAHSQKNMCSFLKVLLQYNGTAELQRTADFQGTAKSHDAAPIPKSPNDFTPTDASQTSGGDGGMGETFSYICFEQGKTVQNSSSSGQTSCSLGRESQNLKKKRSQFKKKDLAHPFFDVTADQDAVSLTRKEETKSFEHSWFPYNLNLQQPTQGYDTSTALETRNDEETLKDFVSKMDSEKEREMLKEECTKLSRRGKLQVTEAQPSQSLKLQVIDSPDGEYLIIHRANNHFRAFDTLWEILHVCPLLGDLKHYLGRSAESSVVDSGKIKEEWEIIKDFDDKMLEHGREVEDRKTLEVKHVEFKLGEDCGKYSPKVNVLAMWKDQRKYAIDVEPIPPRNRNNREVHLHYLRHLKESVDTLREIVEEAKVERPLDRSLAFACRYTKHSQELLEYVFGTCPKVFNHQDKKHAYTPRKKQVTFEDQIATSSSTTYKHVEPMHTQQSNVPVPPSTGVNSCTDASGSQPRSILKKHQISPAKSDSMKKVEEHPRTIRSSLKTTNRVDSSNSSKCTVINSNSHSVCQTCNKCLFSATHDMCVVTYLQSVNASPNVKNVVRHVKQVWKPKQVKQVWKPKHFKQIWKPTVQTLNNVGYQWRPTGRTFTLGHTNRPLVFGLRLFKTYDGGSLKLWNFVNKFFGDSYDSGKHSCYVRDTDGVELLKGSRGSNLYTIFVEEMMKSSLICLISKASKHKSWLWHRRLNHLNFGTINDLARKDLVRGLPRLKFEKDHLCSACQLGKSKKHTHKPKSEIHNLEVLKHPSLD